MDDNEIKEIDKEMASERESGMIMPADMGNMQSMAQIDNTDAQSTQMHAAADAALVPEPPKPEPKPAAKKK
jgi:hypothetical protein